MAIATAPPECRPIFWKRYVDDTLEVIKSGTAAQLTEHLNTVDSTNSIKFTHEEEVDRSLPFLDTLLTRKEDGSVKLQVYWEKTHTNQYLAFDSHHPLHHKMGVVRTLLDRCEDIVSEEEDSEKQRETVTKALGGCGYPGWTIRSV